MLSDKCYHTHCLGLEEVPHGDWYCDTSRHLQPGYNHNNIHNNNGYQSQSSTSATPNRGYLQRMAGTVRARRARRNPSYYRRRNNRNNRLNQHDLSDYMISSTQDPNISMLNTQDQEWLPDHDGDDEDEYEDVDDQTFIAETTEIESSSSDNDEENNDLKLPEPNALERFKFKSIRKKKENEGVDGKRKFRRNKE